MSAGIGRKINLGIAKETTRGTAESSATFWLQKTNAQFDERREFADQVQSLGVIEDAVGTDVVKAFAQGNITMPITDRSIGLVLLSALGAVSTAANTPEAGVQTHTFTLGQSAEHQSLTYFLEDVLAGQDYTHALGVIESLELTYERGRHIEVTLNVRSKKGETATLTSSFSVENLFRSQDFELKLASNLSGLGAAGATVVKRLSLSIEKNLEDDDVLGSNEPNNYHNKEFAISGEVEALWESEAAFKTQYLAGTTKAMRVDLVNSDVTISSSTNPQLTVDLAKVAFKELTRPFNNGDIVMQTLGFKAFYSVSDAKMVEARLVNTEVSY